MIREKRNREKLEAYYVKFMEEGIVDPNVHPWVAESWQRCRQMRIPHETFATNHKLNAEEIKQHLKKHEVVLKYLDGLYEEIKQDLSMHNLSMLLIDKEGYVVKNFAMPFFRRTIEDIQGMRVLEEDVGTSSVSIALEHNTPFMMFGPEMWKRDCHGGDACSAPISVDGELRYVLTIFTMDKTSVPNELLVNHLVIMKYVIENHLNEMERWKVNNILMTQMPAAVYWLDKNGNMKYCNERGRLRLEGKERLQDVFLNYEHLPVAEALKGRATVHQEMTWITAEHTYDDITTAMPISLGSDVRGAILYTVAVEDLHTMIAHASRYSNRNSLFSMVGETPEFLDLQHKASRLARGNRNILLQGEPGTGKQRLAHGIHQASQRATEPILVVKCRNVEDDVMRKEIFGSNDGQSKIVGKLELAKNGTLVIDEAEKLSLAVGDELADALSEKKYNVRLIVACDSNLKRLTDKKLFSRKLYDMVVNTFLKVPSLKDRTADIELIAKHILAEICAQHNMPARIFSVEALELLSKTEWPGNIKQLQGVIEKAFFHTNSSIIDVQHISLPSNKAMEKSWKTDKNAFVAAWKSAGGNISRLSKMLDVSRVTLYRYMRSYGLEDAIKKLYW